MAAAYTALTNPCNVISPDSCNSSPCSPVLWSHLACTKGFSSIIGCSQVRSLFALLGPGKPEFFKTTAVDLASLGVKQPSYKGILILAAG